MTEPPSTSTPRLDPLYDFELVIFRVENTLFRVLKQGFTAPGTAFEEKFLKSNQLGLDAGSGPGQHQDNPIVLTDADEKSFKAFLRALYPFMWQGPVEAYEDWLGVLRLATLWRFHQIRDKAIDALQTLMRLSLSPDADPKDMVTTSLKKIRIGKDYHVQQWVVDELSWLLRQEGLTPQNLATSGVNLGWETAARVFYARRMLSQRHKDFYSIACPTECSCSLEIINMVFVEELQT